MNRKVTLFLLALSLCSGISAQNKSGEGRASGGPKSDVTIETEENSCQEMKDSCYRTLYVTADKVIINTGIMSDGYESVRPEHLSPVREQPADGGGHSAFMSFVMRIPMEIVLAASQLLGVILLLCGIKRNERLRGRRFRETPGGGCILFALGVFIIIFSVMVIRFLNS